MPFKFPPLLKVYDPVTFLEWWNPLVRLRIQKSFKTELRNTTVSDLVKSDFATETEEQIWALCRGDQRSYMTKVKQIAWAFRINSVLLISKYCPELLILLSDDDLAEGTPIAEARSKHRQHMTRYAALAKSQIELPLAPPTSAVKCQKCKSIAISVSLRQTRSADEPMTVFNVCDSCGNRWKSG